MNFNEIEIENYLLGKLIGEALVDFEIRLSLDPELRKEVELQQKVISAIQASRKEELREYIKANASEEKYRSVPLWERNYVRVGVFVAGAFLIVGIVYYFIPENNNVGNKMAFFTSEKPAPAEQKESFNKTDSDSVSFTGNTINHSSPVLDSSKDSQSLAMENKDASGDEVGNSTYNWDYGVDETKKSEDRKNADHEESFAPAGRTLSENRNQNDSVLQDFILADTILYAIELKPASGNEYKPESNGSGKASGSTGDASPAKSKSEEKTLLKKGKIESRAAQVTNGPEKADKIRNISSNNEVKVEYWESAIHFKGYRFFRNVLQLYGVNKNEIVKIFSSDGIYYAKIGRGVYSLQEQNSYNPFTPVKNKEIIDKIYTY